MKVLAIIFAMFVSNSLLAQERYEVKGEPFPPSMLKNNRLYLGEDGSYYERVWTGQEFKWYFVHQTSRNGQTYKTYQNQYGDQVIIKPRTGRSPNPEEAPSEKNLPNRQAIFELGVGYGIALASKESVRYNKNGQTGEFGALYDGSPTSYPKSMVADINIGFHPPVRKLSGLTLGVSANTSMPRTVDPNGQAEYRTDENGNQVFYRATGKHEAASARSFNFIATQDFWYIPGRRESGSIFSAGAYYGYKNAQFAAAPMGSPEMSNYQKDYGAVIRYKFLRDNGHKSVANLYVQTMISKDMSFRVTVGWHMMFGRRNAPKIDVQK